MDEFELIARYFAPLSDSRMLDRKGVRLGIGDDAAVLALGADEELVVTSDMLVAGRHFPLSTAPADVGWKSLAVNVSDLAAMGAEPRGFTLALSLPQAEAQWLASFASGLREAAGAMDIALVGGDTTRGPLTVAITAFGAVPRGQALKRSGARAGDFICVTGSLGDAALALQRQAAGGMDDESLRTRLNRPTPRVAAGMALRGLASAAIDLSDGLAGDLGHILQASGVGARIDAARLPCSVAFERLAPAARRLWLQTAGGDDYELLFCVPPDKLGALCSGAAASACADAPIRQIGVIEREPGLRVVIADGSEQTLPSAGYRHFDSAGGTDA